MKKITVILLCMAMLLSGCAWSVKAEAVSSSEDVWKTIEEAYIYAFPLVLMDATRTSATNTEEAAPGKAPVNQFMHGVALANAQFKNVVTPNVDTIYTQVWYDLSEEPMIYVHPENGIATATIIMSSSNYDYVIVGEEKYLPVNTEGNSTFEIPVTGFDYNMPISADTTAMSTPHEIDYTLYFDSKTIK